MKNDPIWKYIKSYRFNSIFVRNLFLILFLILLPIAVISTAIYKYYDDIIQSEMKAANIFSLSRVKDTIDMIMTENDKILLSLASDKENERFATKKYADGKTLDIVEQVGKISHLIKTAALTNEYIHSVYVYSELNDYIITSNRGVKEYQYFKDKTWVDAYYALVNNRESLITPILRKYSEEYDNTENYILSSLLAIPLYNNVKSGMVMVNVDIERLWELLEKSHLKQKGNIFIIDQNDKVLYCHDSNLINSDISDLKYFQVLKNLEDKTFYIYSNMVVTVVKSQCKPWKYVSVVPLDIYNDRKAAVMKFIYVCAGMSIIIAVVFSFIVATRVYTPIKSILAMLESPEQWDLFKKNENLVNIDEFDFISKNIKDKYNKNKLMEVEIKDRINMAKNAQNYVLQSQINPQFLYNTLESINKLAFNITGSSSQINTIVQSLSELLRITLETNEPTITIYNEIQHAKRYLDIQLIRYKNRFDVCWNIQDEILNYKIIKICIQPLLENAIYHGIKNTKHKGTLWINGYIADNDVFVEIIDNGIGMKQETLETLNNLHHKSAANKHIGVANVSQRIKLTYGEKYGLIVESEWQKGTKVTIHIPKDVKEI